MLKQLIMLGKDKQSRTHYKDVYTQLLT